MTEEEFFRGFFRAWFTGGLGTPAEYLTNDRYVDTVYQELRRHQQERTWEKVPPNVRPIPG